MQPRLLSLLTLTPLALFADKNLVLHLTPPPNSVLAQVKAELKRTGEASPENLAKLDQKTWSVGGFLATYGGYFDYSDPDGSFTFPLRHESPKTLVAITPKISVVKLEKETISHLKADDSPSDTVLATSIPDNQPAKLYSFEKTQDKSKTWIWKVSEQQLPDNRRLSSATLVILSDPKNLFVPLGDLPVTQDNLMLLPPIHVLGRANIAQAITHNLDITKYLEPIKKKTDAAPEPKMERKLVTNY